ncbi:MAG: hypothetical protein EOM22_06920, partial [Gammaproteobacteria bacterium]|nr:hypothetical protein [Gammaproteobacteria bacterium]
MAETPILIDIGHLSCGCTDHALESLHKALATEPPVSTIWAPHQDIIVAGHIEDVTSRGLGILASIEASLPLGRPLAKSQWVRMDDATMELARRRFADRDPDSLDVDDWLLWIDWVVSAHLSPETVLDEAEYLAARAVMAGRIQAAG